MADPYLPSAIESPLVVVSNRGPVTFERNEAGGGRRGAPAGSGGRKIGPRDLDVNQDRKSVV